MAGLFSVFGGGSSLGDASISVPAMDGVLKPNMALEHCERVASLCGIDDLTEVKRAVVASAGDTLHLVTDRGDTSSLARFDDSIGFVAAFDDGRFAVGVRGKGVFLGVPEDFKRVDLPADISACMTAATALPDGRLAICVGSRRNASNEWKRDLMEHGRSGMVLLLDPETGDHQIIANELAYPYGIATAPDGRLLVAESWRHRVIALDPSGGRSMEVLLDDLPAYPARLALALDGGFWLTLFAPRRQLFEFVLREDDFRRDMIASIPPDEWVGPALNASGHRDHPLQQGGVRQMGVLKPWAPSSSYGLVVKCDDRMRPTQSWHSRADGHMHGITGVCETEQGVFLAAKGAETLLRFDNPYNSSESQVGI